jgi:hypothetical protein
MAPPVVSGAGTAVLGGRTLAPASFTRQRLTLAVARAPPAVNPRQRWPSRSAAARPASGGGPKCRLVRSSTLAQHSMHPVQ